LNQSEIKLIENNLHLTNRMLAHILGKSEGEIRNYLYTRMIRRTPGQKQKINLRIASKRIGENNPNWKGGISQDNYHYKKIQVERYPEKIRARQRIYYHKKAGNIIPGVCENCRTDKRIEAHHPDYENPLEVIWLCVDCHREVHQKEREHGKRSMKPSQLSQQMSLFENYNSVYQII
jgi:hypothetical protein